MYIYHEYECKCVYVFIFHHTTCESTCDTLASSAANQGDNTVSVAQGGIHEYEYKCVYVYICICRCVYVCVNVYK